MREAWLALTLVSASLFGACRPRPATEAPPQSVQIEELVVQRWTESKGHAAMKAARATLHDQKRIEAEDVQITFDNGPTVEAPAASWTEGQGEAHFRGGVRIEHRGLVLTSERVVYREAADRIETSTGVRVQGTDFQVSSPGRATWEVGAERARLEGPVELEH